jgi:hypothetical protein
MGNGAQGPDNVIASPSQCDASSQAEIAGEDLPETGRIKKFGGPIGTLGVRPKQVYYDTRGRTRCQPRDVDIGHMKRHFPVPESSSWIEQHDTLLLHEEKGFSVPAVYFVKHFPPEALSANGFTPR